LKVSVKTMLSGVDFFFDDRQHLRLTAPAGTRFAQIPGPDTTELVAGPIELDPGRTTITVHLPPEAGGERSGVINLGGTEGIALDVIDAAAGPVTLTVSDDLGWIPPTELRIARVGDQLPGALCIVSVGDGQIEISWEGVGHLQSADELGLPVWTTMEGGESPHRKRCRDLKHGVT
jgi:hypothetical protein